MYIHTHIHLYIHTYILTYLLTYLPTYIHTYTGRGRRACGEARAARALGADTREALGENN